MKNKKVKKRPTVVSVIAMDSWNGPEVLFEKRFVYRANALKYCKKFNSKNTLSYVPECYEVAKIKE